MKTGFENIDRENNKLYNIAKCKHQQKISHLKRKEMTKVEPDPLNLQGVDAQWLTEIAKGDER